MGIEQTFSALQTKVKQEKRQIGYFPTLRS